MRVGTKSNAADIAKRNFKRAKDLPVEIQKALAIESIHIKRLAISSSSGNVPTDILSAPLNAGGLNHPIGIGGVNWRGPRGPQPYLGMAIWNAQRGDVLAMWQTQSGSTAAFGVPGQTVYVKLFNTNPVAWWLNYGTPKMRPRDVLTAIHNIEDARFTATLRKALKKAWGIS